MPVLSLIAKLGLDKTGFDAGVAAAGKQVNRFGEGLKSQLAGAFSIAAIAAFTRNLIQTVSHIEDLAQKTGVSTEALQEFQYAAKQTGSDIDAVAIAFRALSKARLEALKDGKSEAGQVFSAFGISQADLRAMSLEQTFRRIAEAVRTNDFGASELKMVNELLGRAGDELIPMMKAGLEASTKQARELGLIISDEMVMAIDDAGDAMDRFATKLKATVAPALTFIVNRLRDVYDLADALVGSVGAEIGARLGGANKAEAVAAGRAHIDAVLARREQEDAANEAKRIARREGKPEGPERKPLEFEFAPKEEHEKAKKGFSIVENSLGRIGAFSGASSQAGLGATQMQQLDKLTKIHDALVRRGIVVRDTAP